MASLLGLQLIDVPNFITQHEGYWAAMLAHSAGRGLSMTKMPLKDGKLPFASNPGTPCILRGTSPRGAHGHVIIAVVDGDGTSLSPVHDPHPEGGYLNGPGEWAAFYTCPQPWAQ